MGAGTEQGRRDLLQRVGEHRPLRESSIVIGSLVACRLFGEGHRTRRTAGTAVVLAGIAAISLCPFR